MIPEKGIWNSVWGGFLALLVLVVPVLVGVDLYLQWHSPTMDFYLDGPGSSVVSGIIPGGQAKAASLQTGDVILTVDDVQFGLWSAPQIGQTHLLKVERKGEQLSLAIPAVRVFQLNTLPLVSAIMVALAFWGVGTLLFVRLFWHSGMRLLFLISQTIAITLLFPLSYPAPWSPPNWLLSLSMAGFNLTAPLFFHYTITFPAKLGRPRQRLVGLSLLYSLALVVFRSWLLEIGWECN